MFNQLDRLAEYSDSERREVLERFQSLGFTERGKPNGFKPELESVDRYMLHEHFEDI